MSAYSIERKYCPPNYLPQFKTNQIDHTVNDDIINCELIQIDGTVAYFGNFDDIPLYNIRPGIYIVKKQKADGSFIIDKINIK